MAKLLQNQQGPRKEIHCPWCDTTRVSLNSVVVRTRVGYLRVTCNGAETGPNPPDDRTAAVEMYLFCENRHLFVLDVHELIQNDGALYLGMFRQQDTDPGGEISKL